MASRKALSKRELDAPTQPGRIPCLRCDKPFASRDVRANRLCPRCKELIAGQPSDERVAQVRVGRVAWME